MSDIPKGSMNREQWLREFSQQFEEPSELHIVCDECGIDYTLEKEEVEVVSTVSECLYCGARLYL